VIAHIVLFEPTPEATPEDRREFIAELRSTAAAIPSVLRARVGTVVSLGLKPNIISGQTTYSFAAILEFASAEALETYLKHPRHAQFAQLFWKLCGATLIVDVRLAELSSADADSLV
jgi:hypothetical protein